MNFALSPNLILNVNLYKVFFNVSSDIIRGPRRNWKSLPELYVI